MSPSDSKPPAPAASPGPAAGESFGHYLARERELRGMSLQQIAEQTRIGAGNLKALEQDDRARLPARVFVLGYIRAYAQAIGLNADEAVLRYEEQSQQAVPAEAETGKRSKAGRLIALAAAVALLGGGALVFLLSR